MSDNPGQSNIPLTSKLDELETLLDEQDMPAAGTPGRITKSSNIPILDELITDDDYNDPDLILEVSQPADIRFHLSELAERLEHKLSAELDEIVSILKGNLKESIMAEIKTQLHDQAEQNKQ